MSHIQRVVSNTFKLWIKYLNHFITIWNIFVGRIFNLMYFRYHLEDIKYSSENILQV